MVFLRYMLAGHASTQRVTYSVETKGGDLGRFVEQTADSLHIAQLSLLAARPARSELIPLRKVRPCKAPSGTRLNLSAQRLIKVIRQDGQGRTVHQPGHLCCCVDMEHGAPL